VALGISMADIFGYSPNALLGNYSFKAGLQGVSAQQYCPGKHLC
jgi:hypothetical protein